MARILVSMVLSLAVLAAHAAGESNVDASGLALKGYDPVAYFTENKPVKGRSEFTAQHDGATYRFASAANRDAFAATPGKYAPQYGGYCAFGAAGGYKAPIEPDAWTVVDGKLYLNYSQSVRRQWAGDIPGFVRKADANWPHLRSR